MYVLGPQFCLQGTHFAQGANLACDWHNCRASQTGYCMSSQMRATLGTIDTLHHYMSRTDWQSTTLSVGAWSCGQC